MAITITPNVLGPATKDSPFSATLAGAGGTGPYTFAVTDGALPTGLSLNGTTGAIAGTPTTSGPSSFTITATDSAAATGAQPYNFSVKPPIYWYICARSEDRAHIPPQMVQPEFNRRVASVLDGLGKSRHEVGDLLARPVLKPILDHLLCDGSEIDRASFPQLFAEIGTAWGGGDGSTTFNIPDLIGAALPVPLTAPPQDITPTTASTGEVVETPSGSSQTGGTTGGNVSTGGVWHREELSSI